MDDASKKAAFELLGDQLSSVTRSTKKSLFIFSSLCLLIGFTGIAPEEASVLGFKFPGLTQSFIKLALLAVASYSYLSFLLYLLSDYLRFRIARDRYDLARAYDMISSMAPPDDEREYHDTEFGRETGYIEKHVPHWVIKVIFRIKFFFDFLFPLSFGLVSIVYFYIKCF
jgi:hypothetical protein